MNARQFFEEKDETLDLYTKAITKAHGAHHPEVFGVREVYQELQRKFRAGRGDVAQEFAKLRSLTHGYAIPSDACDAMALTYRLLQQLDALAQA
jgi:iron-sulfur cluster repair protein YtfE (RIC family)